MTSATDRVPCSDQSLARDDQMYGTASAGAKWLMLELAGPWGNSAFLQSPTVIDPQLGRAIARRAEAAGLRIAAIRRPGRRSPEPRWRWFVAHSQVSEETLLHGEVGDPREYLDVSLDGSDGEVASLPLVAVCAHGKHDQCCAVRGRGAVAAIAAHYPSRTDVGMLAFRRRSLRSDDAHTAGGAVLRTRGRGRPARPRTPVSRSETG
ncbi:MAG: hypothetical protein QOJ80_5782 [Mycobacterium sp.]|jgi:hypothetical protein|nr:hypothetical protein [Mycobacterium sp.]